MKVGIASDTLNTMFSPTLSMRANYFAAAQRAGNLQPAHIAAHDHDRRG